MFDWLKTSWQSLAAVLGGAARRQKRRIDDLSSLRGRRAVAYTDLNPTGTVLIDGELWRARASAPVASGAPLIVKGTAGVLLEVESAGEIPPRAQG